MTTGNLYDFSTTDASNTSFAGIAQGESAMKMSDVNNAFRAHDGATRRWLNDLGGTVAVGGTATAITVTLNQPFTAYGTSAGQIPDGAVIMIETTSAATGATTLNVNSIGTKKILKPAGVAIAAEDWGSGQFLLLRYDSSADTAAGAWIIVPTAGRASSFIPTGSTVPVNGMYLAAANTIGWAINSTAELVLTATTLRPNADGGLDLGTSTLGYGALFLKSGGKIDFGGSGDVTLTHSANQLSFAGATSGYHTDTTVYVDGGTYRVFMDTLASGQYGLLTRNDSVGTRYPASFKNSSDVEVGSITSTAAATAFNTSSDYRLKENVTPLVNLKISDDMLAALGTNLQSILRLRPVSYTWIAAPEEGVTHGFIAHEVQEVLPQVVTGEKDAVVDIGTAIVAEQTVVVAEAQVEMDGAGKAKIVAPEVLGVLPERRLENIREIEARSLENATWEKTGVRIAPQQMDMSKMVPDLVAAVQELAVMNIELRQRVAALEA